jgi:hypothetical protein
LWGPDCGEVSCGGGAENGGLRPKDKEHATEVFQTVRRCALVELLRRAGGVSRSS